jgi:hypothetical protein
MRSARNVARMERRVTEIGELKENLCLLRQYGSKLKSYCTQRCIPEDDIVQLISQHWWWVCRVFSVTVRPFCATTGAVEEQCVLRIPSRGCSLSHPARNAHALYYIFTSGLSGLTVCPHYLINSTILGGGPQISVLIFSTTFVRNISHSKKN